MPLPNVFATLQGHAILHPTELFEEITEFNIRLEMPQELSNRLDKCNPEIGQQIIITECQKACGGHRGLAHPRSQDSLLPTRRAFRARKAEREYQRG